MTTTPVVDREDAIRLAVHKRLLVTEGAELLVEAPLGDVRARVESLVAAEDPLLAKPRRDALVAELLDTVRGLGVLEPLLADPTVDEIMVNGAGRCFVERAGVVEAVRLPVDDAGIVRLVERVLAPLGLRLDRSSPMVEARLADGSRLHAIIPPLAIDGPCVTIRRFAARRVELAGFGVDPPVVDAVARLIDAGVNVLISGGTGSGKTTLLNALTRFIGPTDRVITIEETAELRLVGDHVIRLEARPANAEGVGAVSVRDLVRAALRMRPDRLVVGEVRGAEALDLLQALNTGHEGSLSTVHANSPLDALRRISTLALFGNAGLPHEAICDQIRAAIDIVVQVGRTGAGARRIEAIVEVGADRTDGGFEVRPIFERRHGELVACGERVRPPRRGVAS